MLTDTAPADGTPDGWIKLEQSGKLTFDSLADDPGLTRIRYEAGTKASICSSAVPVTAGSTLRLSSQVKGDAALGDVTALHLHITGPRGDLHVAKRRFSTGEYPTEAVEILSTVPPGGYGAYACYEVRMVNADAAGALSVAPLKLESMTADSSVSLLSIRRIVLVTIETFRRDHVHAYGYPRNTTPNLDALIAEGVSFDRHYSTSPYTHPSLASVLTGQFPTALGFADNSPSLPPALPVLPELLAQAGYVTAAFNVQYVLSNRYGLNRGFHYYRNHPNDTPANVLNDELLPFLSEHGDDNLFAWVHYFDPHGPYRPPARFRDMFLGDVLYGADPELLPHGSHAEGLPSIPKYVYDKGRDERRHYVAGYDGDLAWTDFELGRLMDSLRVTSRNDTLVIVSADHGESMTEHERYFCHGSLYEHDLHVPMVVWAPGMKSGTRIAARTSHVDILPTLLDYGGAGKLPGFAGQSLRPAIEGASLTAPPFSVAMVGRNENLRYAVIADNGLKAVTNGKGGLLEAYDLSTDPGETKQAKGSVRAKVRALAKDFRAWLKGKTPVPAPKVQTLDEEDEERLRALGYVE